MATFGRILKEALIQSLSYFATSIMMQDQEKDDANRRLFKESAGAVLYNYAQNSAPHLYQQKVIPCRLPQK